MQDSQNEIPQEEEQNRIEVAINRIADALPDVDIEDLMEKLANYVETNPAMAKMMLTNLK